MIDALALALSVAASAAAGLAVWRTRPAPRPKPTARIGRPVERMREGLVSGAAGATFIDEDDAAAAREAAKRELLAGMAAGREVIDGRTRPA
jgi:hypothetical protein